MSEPLSLCAQEVRKNDHDQFLCSLFVPAEYRQAFWALSLFQIETLRIRDAVSEPHLGLIRLQWWRDALQAKYENRPSQQELGTHKELLESLNPDSIDYGLFERYLNAWAFDMEDQAHDDLDALIHYQKATLGTVCTMKCHVMGLKDNPDTLRAAENVGAALGLVMVIRTLAFQARSNRLKIPISMVRKQGLDLKQLQNLEYSTELENCVQEICRASLSLLKKARETKIDKKAIGVFLISIAIEDYIHRISKRRYNPFDPNIGSGHLKKQLKMAFRASLSGF